MKFSLGLDIGTNSLGWSVVELDAGDSGGKNNQPIRLVTFGSRIFSDGRAIDKSHVGEPLGETLASQRRIRINTMRARKRHKNRLADILKLCAEAKLIRFQGKGHGVRIDSIDPFKATGSNRDAWLRKAAVFIVRADMAQHAIDPASAVQCAQLARALYHIASNRGVYLTPAEIVDAGIGEADSPETAQKGKRRGKRTADASDTKAASDPESLTDEETRGLVEACKTREAAVNDDPRFGKGGLGIWLAAMYRARTPKGEGPSAPMRARVIDPKTGNRYAAGRNAEWNALTPEQQAAIGSQILPGKTSRALVEDEFDRIRMLQESVLATHFASSEASKAWWNKLRETLFKRPKFTIERWPCRYLPVEMRVPRYDPRAQEYLAWEKAWNVRYETPDGFADLKPEQVAIFARTLMTRKGELTWAQAAEALGLSADTRFNRTSTGTGKNASTRTIKEKPWKCHSFPELAAWMRETPMSDEERERVLSVFAAPLEGEERNFAQVPERLRADAERLMAGLMPPKGSIKFGETMLNGILSRIPTMRRDLAVDQTYQAVLAQRATEDQGVRDSYKRGVLPYYARALNGAFPHPHKHRNGPSSFKEMPAAGEAAWPDRAVLPEEREFGRIPNPTVHIALNQTRRIVNEIVKLYGKPTRIVIETTRTLHQSDQGRKKILKRIEENEKRNREARKVVQAVLGNADDKAYGKAIRRLKLWNELVIVGEAEQRLCPFCGNTISKTDAIRGKECEIEHLIPQAQGGGSEFQNLTLCCKDCNLAKTNRTAKDAFSHDAARWEGIKQRIRYMRFKKREAILEPDEARKSFIGGQLESTSWAAKLLLEWLKPLCLVETDVLASRGELTSTLRKAWGLEDLKKDASSQRIKDNRHHALDAFITACLTRSMLQRTAEGRALPWADLKPWVSLADDVRARFAHITASHKYDRPDLRIVHNPGGPALASAPGQLQDQTVYPLTGEKRKEPAGLLPASATQQHCQLVGESGPNTLATIRTAFLTCASNPEKDSFLPPEERARLLAAFDAIFGSPNPSFETFASWLAAKGRYLRCFGKGPRIAARPPDTADACDKPWSCDHGVDSGTLRKLLNEALALEGVAKVYVGRQSEDGEEGKARGPIDKRRTTRYGHRIYGGWQKGDNVCFVIEQMSPIKVRLFKLADLADPNDGFAELRSYLRTKSWGVIYAGDVLRLQRDDLEVLVRVAKVRMDGPNPRLTLADVNTGAEIESEPSLRTLQKRGGFDVGTSGLLGGFSLRFAVPGI